MKKIIGDYDLFLEEVLDRLVSAGFDLADFIQIDHICYRTSSDEMYASKKKQLHAFARLLGTNMVNGREISTFRLDHPILRGGWRVDFIELPAPKEGKSFKDGLEHIELVIYDDIPTFLEKYKGRDFDLRAVDRGINPEIGLQLGDYSVKFHLLSLGTVVYLESKLGITSVDDGK